MNLTLEQVIKFARATDLKNFAVINNYDELIQILNLVLIELHARFTLKQDIMTIPLSADKTTYKLTDYLKEEEVTQAELDTIVADSTKAVTAAFTPQFEELKSKLDTNLVALETKVNNYEELVKSIPADFTTTMNSINNKLTVLETAVTPLSTKMTELSDTVTASTQKVDVVEANVNSINSTLTTALTALAGRVNTLEAATGDATALNEINTKLDTISGNITDLTTRVKALEDAGGTDVTTIQSDIASIKTSIQVLETNNETMTRTLMEFSNIINSNRGYQAGLTYYVGDTFYRAEDGHLYVVTTQVPKSTTWETDSASFKVLV